ncbi:sensor domain-containing diguanylate cyclase [Pantoea septica]|uniref:sensor domain-containing diguanylate cyclase n=1 Tax=Pantoea septica TaxID=472695 RepID=UPI0028A1D514|nr:diguanylate cyclase [Pantoea septica]
MKLKRRGDRATSLNRSLPQSIAMAGLLLTVAVTGLNLWTMREAWRDTLIQSEQMAINLSLSQARQADDTILQTELSLREVRHQLMSEMASGVNGAALSQTMWELASRLPQLHGLFYYDAQGKWIATSAQTIPRGINNSDREYFHYHRMNPRDSVHIGPVIRSRSTGDLVIPVSLRVNDVSGGFNGVLLATIRVDYFRHYYSYYELGPQDVLVLMLADSTVLYARPMPDSYIGKNLSSSHLFQSMLASSDKGSGQWRAALDGQARIFGFARSERYGLVVAAGYDKHNLLRSWIKGQVEDVLLDLALLAGIVLLGAYILSQARRSLRYQQELTRLRDELTAVNLSLENLAHADGLTGLANRRQFDHFLQQSLLDAAEHGQQLSLILMDIDYFKRYNDTYGHVAGDACLKTVASALKGLALRSEDRVARYGGEEFAIILSGTAGQDALNVANAAVKAVSARNIPHDSSSIAAHVTLSAGCATFLPESDRPEPQALIEKADEALYLAKHSGRNQARRGA